MGKDGIAQCSFEDVEANCAVRNIYVNVANQDNQIILVVYHNALEASADCICKYDVSFKMSKLLSGSYQLKVYCAGPNMKYDERYIVYNGQINIAKNKKTIITFSGPLTLPEN